MWYSRRNNKLTIIIKLEQMRKMILGVALFAAIGFTSCNNKQKEKATKPVEKTEQIAINNTSFGVRGNCGMCKKTIEKAASSVEGVSKAIWSRDQKKIDVSFDSSITNDMAIQKAVAASGYDTEKVKGNLEAYDGLPGCCKYDHSMEMNQKEGAKEDDHSGHNH